MLPLKEKHKNRVEEIVENHKHIYNKNGRINAEVADRDIYTVVQRSKRTFFEVTSTPTSTIINIQDNTENDELVEGIKEVIDSTNLKFKETVNRRNFVKLEHNYKKQS